ncbi:PAS domain-containing protein, partial [Belnapia sp. T18]
VGWLAGRLGALLSGVMLLAVYVRQVDFLYTRAETTAVEREAARAELESARDNLAIALEAADMGDWELDLATDTARRTLRHDQIFGYKTLQPTWGKDVFLEHVLSDDRAGVEAAFASALERGTLQLECRIRRASDSEVRWIAVRGKTSYDAAGRPTGMAGVVMDTTERKMVEERLR